MLLNPRAVTNGVGGTVINGYFDPGKLVAFPQDVNEAVLARFGEAPPNKDTNKDGQYNELDTRCTASMSSQSCNRM
jgi:hypothetical protein